MLVSGEKQEQILTGKWNLKKELGNVAINDVLPLKATRGNAIVNLKYVLGPRHTGDLIFTVSFT